MIDVKSSENNKFKQEGEKAFNFLNAVTKEAMVYGLGATVVAGKAVAKVGKKAVKGCLDGAGDALHSASNKINTDDTAPNGGMPPRDSSFWDSHLKSKFMGGVDSNPFRNQPNDGMGMSNFGGMSNFPFGGQPNGGTGSSETETPLSSESDFDDFDDDISDFDDEEEDNDEDELFASDEDFEKWLNNED
jgi:hypothetical protein